MSLGGGLLYNIDSRIELDERTWLYSTVRSWVYTLTHDVRVYLVSPDTMDSICPPERVTGIPVEYSERIGSILDDFFKNPSLREIDRVLGEIEGLSRRYSALGVFIAPTSSKTISVSGGTIELPAIILCLERILDEARVIGKELGLDEDKVFRPLLRIVLAHEQAHALSWKMSRGETYREYKKMYVRVIEEALAQMVAYTNPPRRVSSKGVYEYVMLVSAKRQPVEYSTWRTLIPLLEDRLDVFTYLYMYTTMMTTKRVALLYPLIPFPPHPLYFPVTPYLLRTLHAYYRMLGPFADIFFHEVIEPVMKGLRNTEDLLKIHALSLLHTYTLTTR